MFENKYSLTPEQSLFLAKKKWDENVYCGMRMENRAVTFPQTKTILNGVNVPNVQLDDIQAILNMRDAWRYLLGTVEEPLTLEYICTLNGFIARNEALVWGKLRTGKVGISGTEYIPSVPVTGEAEEELAQILSADTTATEKALNVFVWGARKQLFWDGNKRTSLTAANKIMVENGVGMLTITDRNMERFNELLLDYYNTGAPERLKYFYQKGYPMIIRRLRENENKKLDAIQSLAFSFSFDYEKADEDGLESEVYGAFLDDDTTLTATIFTPEYDSFYHGKPFKSVGIGGVASVPEYRRMGSVRAIFDEIFRLAPERGWATSFLYPFSFAYYRQFGYERVMRRMRVKVSASQLKNIPRNTSAKLYMRNGDVKPEDLLTVYNAYAESYDGMFRRSKAHTYSDEPHKSQKLTYLWYDGETPAALATFRCKDGTMRVSELCYTSPEALRGILGFLRMFEGQVYEYCFEELPENSELDLLFADYVDAEYSLHNGAMGRVLLPQVLLENTVYPHEYGHFRLQLDDSIGYNRAVYAVEYGHGDVQVVKMPFDTPYDLSVNAPALARILLGCERFDARRAAYIDGVKVNGTAEDFFRAFTGRANNLLEKF